jgi:positive regulator of sigma E activity
MEERGTVIEIRDRTALVRMSPLHAERCGACRACSLGEGEEHIVEVPSVEGLSTGEKVVIEVPLPSKYLGVLLFFVLPMALLAAGCVAGYFLGERFFGKEPAADALIIALGAAGLAVSYPIVKLIDRHVLKRRAPPRIVEVIKP